MDFLKGLKPEATDREVGLYHASPRDPVWEYVLAVDQARECMEEQSGRVSLIGHSHVALYFSDGGEDGLGGQAPDGHRDRPRPRAAGCSTPAASGSPATATRGPPGCELDTDEWKATYHRVEYDIDSRGRRDPRGRPPRPARRPALGGPVIVGPAARNGRRRPLASIAAMQGPKPILACSSPRRRAHRRRLRRRRRARAIDPPGERDRRWSRRWRRSRRTSTTAAAWSRPTRSRSSRTSSSALPSDVDDDVADALQRGAAQPGRPDRGRLRAARGDHHRGDDDRGDDDRGDDDRGDDRRPSRRPRPSPPRPRLPAGGGTGGSGGVGPGGETACEPARPQGRADLATATGSRTASARAACRASSAPPTRSSSEPSRSRSSPSTSPTTSASSPASAARRWRSRSSSTPTSSRSTTPATTAASTTSSWST